MTESPRLPDPADGADAKRHGDPLLASAQGENDGDDGSRQGTGATGAVPPPEGSEA
ncbi:MAG TPA: hypothetical protein VM433_03345 [Mycobacteriales bacterium]|nr:hypothetical protein [Mycobacteriales bacterium]